MKKLLHFFIDFFDFSPSNKRGIFGFFILVFILVVAIKGIEFYNYETHISSIPNHNALDGIALVLKKEKKASSKSPKRQITATTTQKPKRIKPSTEQTYLHKKKTSPIPINSADTTLFKTIKGIGSYYAKKIVNFRKGLHGFHSKTQLNEVFGLEEFDFATSEITLDTVNTKWINPNTHNIDELKSHPYISINLAKQIINFREKVHPFKKEDDLLQLYFIDSLKLEQLRPYLLVREK